MIATLEVHEWGALLLTFGASLAGCFKLIFRWVAAYVEQREKAHQEDLLAARKEREETRTDFLAGLAKIAGSVDLLAQQREKDRAQLDVLHTSLLKLAGLNGGGASHETSPTGVSS